MPDDVEKKISAAETPPVPETAALRSREAAPVPERAPAQERISEVVPVAPVPASAPPSAASADPVVRTIEKILSEDLYEHFQAMSPAAQARFKAKGEETVSKLAALMNRAVIGAKEVLNLIVSWLKLIPGVNKYFLEQESKIKADKILELHKRQHGGE